MLLLDVYWQPLKLISVISPQSLFNLMENVTRKRFANIIDKIYKQISVMQNPLTEELVLLLSHILPILTFSKLRKVYCKGTAIFSVLKWSLLSNGNFEGDKVRDEILFQQEDVKALVDCHIPLSLVNKSSPTFINQLIPMILALDGPIGMRLYEGCFILNSLS